MPELAPSVYTAELDVVVIVPRELPPLTEGSDVYSPEVWLPPLAVTPEYMLYVPVPSLGEESVMME